MTFLINIYNKPSSPRLNRNCSIYIDGVNKPSLLLQALSTYCPVSTSLGERTPCHLEGIDLGGMILDWKRFLIREEVDMIKYSLVFHLSQVESIFKVSILPIYIYINTKFYFSPLLMVHTLKSLNHLCLMVMSSSLGCLYSRYAWCPKFQSI